MALSEIKTNIQKQEQNINPIQMVVKKSGKYTYTPMNKVKTIQQKTKMKYSRLTWWTKEIKNNIYELRRKLTKAQTWKLK